MIPFMPIGPNLREVTIMSYRVEFNDCNGNWAGREFWVFQDAADFYNSKRHADLLSFVEYNGYNLVARK